MLKIKFQGDGVWNSANGQLYESSQLNPMRWKVMYRQEDGTFIDQERWIKCKDYFNDVVARYHGHPVFTVYGYKNDMKFNTEGLWVLVKYVDQDQFPKNLEVLNKQLSQDLGCQIAWQEGSVKDEVMMLWPFEMLASTYVVSLLALCIRRSNAGVACSKFVDFFQQAINAKDAATHAMPIEWIKKHGFKVPDAYKKFWWYAGKGYNSVAMPLVKTATILHNNGCQAWAEQFLVEEKSPVAASTGVLA